MSSFSAPKNCCVYWAAQFVAHDSMFKRYSSEFVRTPYQHCEKTWQLPSMSELVGELFNNGYLDEGCMVLSFLGRTDIDCRVHFASALSYIEAADDEEDEEEDYVYVNMEAEGGVHMTYQSCRFVAGNEDRCVCRSDSGPDDNYVRMTISEMKSALEKHVNSSLNNKEW